MGKKRPGRPTLTKGKGKQATVIVRVLPGDRKSFERAAAASRMKLSDWVRAALITAAGSVKIEKDAEGVGVEPIAVLAASPRDVKAR